MPLPEVREKGKNSRPLPIALVTGGALRVGRMISLALSRLGYQVVIHYNQSKSAACETRDQILAQPGQASILQADLTNVKAIQQLFFELDKLDGTLDLLVNSAATMQANDILSLSKEDFASTMDLNLRAPLFCSQLAADRMKERGSIINISDYFADQAWSKYPLYGLSKTGIEHLTKILAKRLKPHIRVNCLALAPVLPPDGYSTDEWERLLLRSPGGDAVKGEQISQALEYVIKNEYISGQIIRVTALGLETTT